MNAGTPLNVGSLSHRSDTCWNLFTPLGLLKELANSARWADLTNQMIDGFGLLCVPFYLYFHH
jgi:hypothetical protein